jgi:mRNA (guanine-N7-)-methyltransferase
MSREERAQSSTIGLKCFNNWLKTVLLSLYCRKGDFVLDLCGGKGGDLGKWARLGVGALVLADVASESVKQAAERYADVRHKHAFPCHFVDADCSLPQLWRRNPELNRFLEYGLFDFVSCQFALHYAFETEARARALIDNAASRLRPGGHFVCTVPNAHKIVKRLRTTCGLAYGNSLYAIQVRAPKFTDSDVIAPFGAEYFFTLADAVENCAEYLVHPGVLTQLAGECGLDLVLHQTFEEFYDCQVTRSDNRSLLQRMRADDVSDEEWEAICVYSVFAFRKRGAVQKGDAAILPSSDMSSFVPTIVKVE